MRDKKRGDETGDKKWRHETRDGKKWRDKT